MMKMAGLDNEDIVRLQGFEVLKVAADGQSTKVVIPSDIQNISSTIAGIKETIVE